MNEVVKRGFDIFFSAAALCVLVVPMILIGILIKLDSNGSIFFIQERVGKNFRKFRLFKFRSMVDNQVAQTGLFEPGNTKRVTRVGKFLRKYKLDELPQFINVLKGDMSIVGPRPEVEKWTKVYPEMWKEVLSVRPGITDFASIEFRNEEEILQKSSDPEKTYKEVILPKKLALNIRYINERSILTDAKIIGLTFFKIIK